MIFTQEYFAKKSDKVEFGELFYFKAGGKKHLTVCADLDGDQRFVHLATILEDGSATPSDIKFRTTKLAADVVGLSLGKRWSIGCQVFKQDLSAHVPGEHGYLAISETDRFLMTQLYEDNWNNAAWLNLTTSLIQLERPKASLIFGSWRLWESEGSAVRGDPPLLTVEL